MSIISKLRDRYITAPILKTILDGVKVDNQPEVFDVPFGFNTGMALTNKRQTTSNVDFKTLRALSINHETTRNAINTRKRQITQLDYEIVDVDSDADANASKSDRLMLKAKLEDIGGIEMRFSSLLDRLMEDLLVLDACVFYKQRDRSGKLLKIIPVDGATIKLRVDQSGQRPQPPEIAYEQWIKGKLAASLTTDEMVYEMMNPRNDSPYGLSPIESLLMTIDSSMRSMLYNLNYLSDNNVPQGFLNVPEGWTIQQIKEYKEFFDSMVSGSKATSKIYPIPSGASYIATSKPTDFAFKDFFEYLDRKVVTMFDLTPQELGINTQQYKENAETQDKIQVRKGIKPLANFLAQIFNDIIRKEWGFPQYQFKFTGLDGRWTTDELQKLVPIGVVGIDEARADRRLQPIGIQNVFINNGGVIPADQVDDVLDASLKAKETRIDATVDTEEIVDPTNKIEKADVKQNDFLDKLGRKKQFKQFKSAIQEGLKNQILPFTYEAKIAEATKTTKADEFDIEAFVDGEVDSIDIKDLNEYLSWAAIQGGQNALNKLDVSGVFKLTNKRVLDLLAEREGYLIDSVDATTKDYIVNTIINGKQSSMTNAEIAQELADNIDEISSSRADTIVNTEVANAAMQAELAAYEDQGVEMYTWELSEDIGDECGDNAEAGAIALGEEFPSGDDAPPAHPNCRCFLNAVVSGATLDE